MLCRVRKVARLQRALDAFILCTLCFAGCGRWRGCSGRWTPLYFVLYALQGAEGGEVAAGAGRLYTLYFMLCRVRKVARLQRALDAFTLCTLCFAGCGRWRGCSGRWTPLHFVLYALQGAE